MGWDERIFLGVVTVLGAVFAYSLVLLAAEIVGGWRMCP